MPWPKAMQAVVKTGPDREVVSVYPYRSACPTSVWAGLIHAAKRDLVFAGYTHYFLWTSQPVFPATVRDKWPGVAASGSCWVIRPATSPDSGKRSKSRTVGVPL